MLNAEEQTANILVVDDTANNLRILTTTLSKEGYKVRPVTSGKMALKAVETMVPDLILLDIKMPEMDGYEVCQKLKEIPETKEIPVIFLSALDDAIDKVKAFRVGGLDYITKPFQLEEVLVRVENQLKLQEAKKEINKLNQELEVRVKQRTAQLETANRALKKEISQKEKYQKQLVYKAFHDDLTGLPNRALFMSRLEDALRKVKNEENYLFAVLFLDCDRFKVVNDSLGHLVGDQLLVAVASRLESCWQQGELIARFGGDEFTILIEEINNIQEAQLLAEKIHQSFDKSFRLGENELYINVSIGIVLCTKDYQQADTILRDADTAMYRAKELGRNRSTVFDVAMHKRNLTVLKLENDLRRAMEREEFTVYYQPIVSLRTGDIISFEALLRWQHPEKGLITPIHFIPKAEETELILPLGMWILEQACSQLSNWQNQGLVSEEITISVNLSIKQFSDVHILNQIYKILQKTNLDGSRLNLEITESSMMENPDVAIRVLQQMRMRKINLSIDDFGSGYSSLNHLYRFPVNALKIDQSFISRIGNNGENLEIVQAIITLAHQLKMKAIAEGIETAKQFDFLRGLGCDFGQGYFFSKALDANSVEKVLRKKVLNSYSNEENS
ncbi:MAG: EAL domain-containing protein [Gomphosphaeria aponina SAG 52.96 = DSM 107014]|uniref:EAL domain-containing protein n=1 Tax=Gomphosphaeria aponina SAG 52.96 = DSM 107014 TaxID=1521640 RepID=A0A941GR42_9CHRO|nr:EAL domain-containing protein [Gomphosphaeria aponina SAG 52.96 = DSM 107014]